MQRRQFLRYGGAGLLAGAQMGLLNSSALAACSSTGSPCVIRLGIGSMNHEMIDGQVFPMLGFRRMANAPGEAVDIAPRFPGPVLRVLEGQMVTLQVTNYRPEPHSVHIPGAGIDGSVVRIDNIPTNQTRAITFQAPVAGTYMYHDPSHPSRHLYRLLGLQGIMVVHPLRGQTLTTGSTVITPYSMDKLKLVSSTAATAMTKVFEAFGNIPRFPGSAWAPASLNEEFSAQERIWLFSEVDPDYNTLIKPTGIFRAATDRVIKRTVPVPATAAEMVANWTPRYFTINGKSGFDLAEEPSVVCRNFIGEPTLLRIACGGLSHHATHIHGNHLLELAHSHITDDGLYANVGVHRTANFGEPIVHDNIWERDVWPTWPMQTRDMLLPYEAPPDIPNWSKFEIANNEEPFPLRYVMHDHCEMATTAAGGNYPQGAVTHWEILGPVRRPV